MSYTENFEFQNAIKVSSTDFNANTQPEGVDNEMTINSLDVLSNVPTYETLERSVEIGFVSGRYSREVETKTFELGTFLAALCKVGKSSRTKDGVGFVQGASIDGENRNLRSIELLAFDIDDGPDPDMVADHLTAGGVGFAMYPSFNDGRRFEHGSRKEIHEWINEQSDSGQRIEMDEVATDEKILHYFRHHLPSDIASEIHSPRFKAGYKGRGGRYFVSIPIKRKYRIVVALDRAIDRSELGDTKRLQSRTLAAARRLLADRLGVRDDEACDDISRIFYAPRRGPGYDFWFHQNFTDGRAIDTNKLLDLARAKLASDSLAATPKKQRRAAAKTNHGRSISKSNVADPRAEFDVFWKRHGKSFDVEEFVRAYDEDFEDKEDLVEAQCPNRHGSDLGDGRTSDGHADLSLTNRTLIAVNADRSEVGVPVMSCNHNTCQQDLRTADFVYLIMKQNDLDASDLSEFAAPGGGSRIDDESITDASSFDTDKEGEVIYKTRRNFRVAIAKLHVSVKLNEFTGLTHIDGLQRYPSRLSDAAATHLQETLVEEFGLYFLKDRIFRLIDDEAHRNAFHPVRERFDGLRDQWDGIDRIDRLLIDYFGAEDTELHRWFGRLTMIAVVRRIMKPGCKFDQVLLLQGAQGVGKSTAIRILAMEDEWFTDNLSISPKSQEVIEQTSGKLIVEVPELSGMRMADKDHVKAFLSRTVDIARPAYGRVAVERPRQFMILSTTNEDKPLKDPTGNRRWWPVKCGQIDLGALKGDLDQLWAEATVLEKAGEPIELPKELYDTASNLQKSRMLEDAYKDKLELELGSATGKIPAEYVYEMIGLKASAKQQYAREDVGKAMLELGWEKNQLRYNGKKVTCFVRGVGKERQRKINVVFCENERRRRLCNNESMATYRDLMFSDDDNT